MARTRPSAKCRTCGLRRGEHPTATCAGSYVQQTPTRASVSIDERDAEVLVRVLSGVLSGEDLRVYVRENHARLGNIARLARTARLGIEGRKREAGRG